ncbi:MAG: NAD(P)-dependent alcohol dehydrogenase [Ardenticatenaceae bacterium]|nr:NAD(P)-dependent alcohol dehydrogenase [Ardenticatenaceae bacterium]
MKAFKHERYGASDVLELQEVQKPVAGAGEVLVKTQAAALNPADWRTMRGDPFFIRLETGLFQPKFGILGADIAGRVEAVGPGVTRFKPGDEVFGDIGAGGFAEYACAPEEKFALKPTNLSLAEAAAVPKAAITALQGIRDYGQTQPGQTVLINGASGGVGTFAVQIAKSLGAIVTGVCSTRNLELVRSIGADHVVDYTREDFTNQTYDLIFDAVGNRSVGDYQRALKPAGIGVIAGFTTLTHMVKIMLLGPWISKRGGQKIAPMNANINQKDLGFLKGLIEAGHVKPVIDRCYPFGQIPEAVAYLEKGHARGKVVITVK